MNTELLNALAIIAAYDHSGGRLERAPLPDDKQRALQRARKIVEAHADALVALPPSYQQDGSP